jgi:hypothetical protein
MRVVRHQAIAVDENTEALLVLGEKLKELPSHIGFGEEANIVMASETAMIGRVEVDQERAGDSSHNLAIQQNVGRHVYP